MVSEMRKFLAAVTALLLAAAMSSNCCAIGFGGYVDSGGGEGEGTGRPVFEEGNQKSFGATEETALWETYAEETTEETVGAAQNQGGRESPVSGSNAEPDETVVPTEEQITETEPQESLTDRLFIRKVEQTETWKLAVPGFGAVAALAALIWLQKKGKTGQTPGQEEIPKTTFQSWDGT